MAELQKPLLAMVRILLINLPALARLRGLRLQALAQWNTLWLLVVVAAGVV
jgi:hypothetical protein